MSKESRLPQGWCWATLGELTKESLNGYGKRSQEAGTPSIVLRLADIERGEVSLASPRRVNSSDAEVEKYRLLPDDLLGIRVNGSPDLVGRLIRFRGSAEPIMFCDHFIRLRLSEPSMARFVRFYADTFSVRKHVDQHKVSSAGQNTVSQGTLDRVAVPVPPLNEQGRIVVKVEELFSDLDAGVAALERARANLKRYRAAVLKAAVEGELTEEWRASHPAIEPASKLLERILVERRRRWEVDQLPRYSAKSKTPPKNWQSKYIEPGLLDKSGLPELPPRWCWASLEQLVARSEYGTSIRCEHAFDGPPVLRIPNISQGRIDLSDLKRASGSLVIDSDSSLHLGDLLMCRTNGSVSLLGKTAVVKEELTEKHGFASYLLRFRFVEPTLLPRWAHLICGSQLGRRFIEKNAASSAGQHNVSLSLMHRMQVPLPPPEEGEKILAQVDELMSIADAAEAQIEANLLRATLLRQSILNEAFEGKLVPQNPSDEPASVLLERIRQQPNGDKPRRTPRPPKGRRS